MVCSQFAICSFMDEVLAGQYLEGWRWPVQPSTWKDRMEGGVLAGFRAKWPVSKITVAGLDRYWYCSTLRSVWLGGAPCQRKPLARSSRQSRKKAARLARTKSRS